MIPLLAEMRCIASDAVAVSERPELTARGDRRFRCRACGKQFNERSGRILNRAQYPSDVIALVVFRRVRYKLSLRDPPEMFLIPRIEFTYNWSRVSGTTEIPQFDERVRHQIHAVVPPLDKLESQKQPFEFILPREGSLHA